MASYDEIIPNLDRSFLTVSGPSTPKKPDDWQPVSPVGGDIVAPTVDTAEIKSEQMLAELRAHLDSLPSPRFNSRELVEVLAKQRNISTEQLSDQIDNIRMALVLAFRANAINARFDAAWQSWANRDYDQETPWKDEGGRSKPEPLEKNWIYSPVTPKTVRIASPASMLAAGGGGGFAMKGFSAIQTFMSAETGDLIWNIPENEENEFVGVDVLYEEPQRIKERVKVSLEECSFEQIVVINNQLGERFNFSETKLPDRTVWDALKGKTEARRSYLKSHIFDPDTFDSTINDLLPETEHETNKLEGDFRFGVVLKERTKDGSIEATKIYIYPDPVATPPRSLFGRAPSVDWYADVICASGSKTTYKFGDPRLKGQLLVKKPVFYAYSDQDLTATFRLSFDGEVVAEYPKSDSGAWTFKVGPDGHLGGLDGKTYPYGFWEGVPTNMYGSEFAEGYCVEGSKSLAFFEQTLPQLGLNEIEMTDFITFWYPVMQKNPYNLIRFAKEEYASQARFEVEPQPDVLIRVFMIFKATDSPMDIAPQAVKQVSRHGFTVVEWGGCNLDEYK